MQFVMQIVKSGDGIPDWNGGSNPLYAISITGDIGGSGNVEILGDPLVPLTPFQDMIQADPQGFADAIWTWIRSKEPNIEHDPDSYYITHSEIVTGTDINVAPGS